MSLNELDDESSLQKDRYDFKKLKNTPQIYTENSTKRIIELTLNI